MVKCWNCKHLVTAYSGKVAKGKLFEKELRKCRVKGIVLGYYKIMEERKCEASGGIRTRDLRLTKAMP